MARTKTMTSIDSEIQKLEAALVAAKKKYDSAAETLQAARKQKQEAEAKQILEAYRQSGKSFRELMTFLGG